MERMVHRHLYTLTTVPLTNGLLPLKALVSHTLSFGDLIYQSARDYAMVEIFHILL